MQKRIMRVSFHRKWTNLAGDSTVLVGKGFPSIKGTNLLYIANNSEPFVMVIATYDQKTTIEPTP